MVRTAVACLIAVFVVAEAAPAFLRVSSSVNDRSSVRQLQGLIETYRAINPGFSESSCTAMFETKVKLGSAVPPGDFVTGCDKVCGSAKAIKEYWGSGDMAKYSCGVVSSFGCVWDGTPPL